MATPDDRLAGWKSSSSSLLLLPAWSPPVCPNAGLSCGCDDRIEAMQPGDSYRIWNCGGGECDLHPQLCLLEAMPLEDNMPALKGQVSNGGEMAAPSGGVYGWAEDEVLKAGDKYV